MPETRPLVPPGLPLPGFRHLPARLDAGLQAALMAEVLNLAEGGAWFVPTMPRSGRPLSVAMANLGPLGWVTDAAGYRYVDRHPVTGRPWPPIPTALLTLWDEVAGYGHGPECCLVNLYREGARMGLHQDRDEAALDAPVLSVSLGDVGIFRVGGTTRRGPTVSLRLESGDVLVMGGPSRLGYS